MFLNILRAQFIGQSLSELQVGDDLKVDSHYKSHLVLRRNYYRGESIPNPTPQLRDDAVSATGFPESRRLSITA